MTEWFRVWLTRGGKHKYADRAGNISKSYTMDFFVQNKPVVLRFQES